MFLFFSLYVKLLTAILSWGSFLLAILTGVRLLLDRRRKFFGWCCVGYAVLYLIFRFFFAELFFQWVPGIAIFLTIICTTQSRYYECINGKRWWNW